MERLWKVYQDILNNKNSNWKKLNEARAILYCLGYWFPEQIALGSMNKRIKFIKPEISLDDFLGVIDNQDEKILSTYKDNELFNKVKDFYLVVKSIKNRVNKDGSYLDEDSFNKYYGKLKPRDYV